MSNLLEKAIVDAKALKEVALKNAEQLVIEKYSKEVKSAMDRILEEEVNEQEDPLAMMDTATDPMDFGPDVEQDPTFMGDPAISDPSGEDEEATFTTDSLKGNIPDAFDTDDDELIMIKLDSLEADLPDEDGPFGGDFTLDDDEIGIDIIDDDDSNLSDLEPSDDAIDPSTGEVGIDITSDLVQEIMTELGLESSSIDFEDLVEKVRIDFEPQKSGWAGTPEPIMKEYESMLLAREQDTEAKEENEKLRKNAASLKQENKTLSSAANKLQIQNNKYKTAFNTLQEKLETMNVSNAKLLYINQALENASLNERQRRKIVETISKAETVQEAKIIFETLNNTVTTNSDGKRPATLNEVVSRKSSLLVAARKEQRETDANPLYNRMRTLAGIKTK